MHSIFTVKNNALNMKAHSLW